jgi:hypothetical protein
MTEKEFRRIALSLAGAVEGAHMGHPDFRANGRIFATLHHERQFGMVALTPDQQQQFVSLSTAFTPEAGAWGRGGSTRVALDTVDPEVLGEALTLAWQNSASRAVPRRRRSSVPEGPPLRNVKGAVEGSLRNAKGSAEGPSRRNAKSSAAARRPAKARGPHKAGSSVRSGAKKKAVH